jgi:hypothetical protein
MLASVLERLRERNKKSEKLFLVDFFLFLKLGPAQGTTPARGKGAAGSKNSRPSSISGQFPGMGPAI